MADWVRAVVLGVVVIIFLPSCGSNTAPTPTQANITVTLSPNPVTSIVCAPDPCQSADGRQFQWRVQGTLAIQETDGVGGSVNSVTVTAFNPQIVIGSDAITQRSGTNRVAARGTLIVPISIIYGVVANPNASRQIVMPFLVDFTDDRGHQLSGIAQWNVS